MFRINYNAEEIWHPFMELVRCLEEGGGMIYEKILEK